MKVRTQYDALDPDVAPSDPMLEFEQGYDELDVPDDAYTIDKHGNTVKDPLAGAADSVEHARKAWVLPLAIVLVITFVGLTAWNVNRAVKGPPPPPKPTATQVKQTLYLGVMRVDLYRRARGVTPETLQDVGLPVNVGYTYQRVDSTRYVLAFENSGQKLEYDSSVSKESFFGSPREVLTMGGPQ